LLISETQVFKCFTTLNLVENTILQYKALVS
jgi:hypothetical protein